MFVETTRRAIARLDERPRDTVASAEPLFEALGAERVGIGPRRHPGRAFETPLEVARAQPEATAEFAEGGNPTRADLPFEDTADALCKRSDGFDPARLSPLPVFGPAAAAGAKAGLTRGGRIAKDPDIAPGGATAGAPEAAIDAGGRDGVDAGHAAVALRERLPGGAVRGAAYGRRSGGERVLRGGFARSGRLEGCHGARLPSRRRLCSPLFVPHFPPLSVEVLSRVPRPQISLRMEFPNKTDGLGAC